MYKYIQLTSSAGQSKANNADTNQTSVHIRQISADKRPYQIECIRQEKSYFVINFDSFTLWGIVVKKKQNKKKTTIGFEEVTLQIVDKFVISHTSVSALLYKRQVTNL